MAVSETPKTRGSRTRFPFSPYPKQFPSILIQLSRKMLGLGEFLLCIIWDNFCFCFLFFGLTFFFLRQWKQKFLFVSCSENWISLKLYGGGSELDLLEVLKAKSRCTPSTSQGYTILTDRKEGLYQILSGITNPKPKLAVSNHISLLLFFYIVLPWGEGGSIKETIYFALS